LQLIQERAENTLEVIDTSNDFLSSIQQPETERKDGQMGLDEIKKLLHDKRNGLQIEETTHRVGENIC
jgi:hypothetical protein